MKHSILFIFFLSITSLLHAQTIQERLNKGETPKQIIKSGVPKDSLYGNIYQGGHIFYFFKDTTGMVFGTKDLAYDYDSTKTRIIWSCRMIVTGSTDTHIGAGLENTKKIKEKNCPLYDPDAKEWMISAAELCLLYKGGGFNDWFLPSKDELHEAYMNLSHNALVHFNEMEYWTSSEKDGEFAWIEHFKGPSEYEMFGQSYYRKFYKESVRDVRVFK